MASNISGANSAAYIGLPCKVRHEAAGEPQLQTSISLRPRESMKDKHESNSEVNTSSSPPFPATRKKVQLSDMNDKSVFQPLHF